MWKKLKSMVGSKEPEPPAPRIGPLGLVLGGSWSCDLFSVRAVADAFHFEVTDSTQVIVAAGEADLGDGVTLHRYYDDDDHMLQVLTGSRDLHDIREVTLFQSFDSIVPGSAAGWDEFLGSGGWMRQPVYELDDGTVYRRAWFEETAGPAELVEFTEFVRRERGTSGQRVQQQCMLYSRAVPGADADEHLLAIHERADGIRSIELMVGIDISATQLTVY